MTADRIVPPSIDDAPRALAPNLSLGAPEAGWAPLTAAPLVVLVGLAGVGKTTLAARLAASGLVVLPDRRALTDLVILPLAGTVATAREDRFAATARFRAAAPGGMADVLAALSAPEDGSMRLFDGLRGAAEVEAFASAAPRARFVALDADDATRAARIAGRADGFDAAAPGGRADMARAADIVRAESDHYAAADTFAALRSAAEDRSLFIDTSRVTAHAAYLAAAAFLSIAPKGEPT